MSELIIQQRNGEPGKLHPQAEAFLNKLKGEGGPPLETMAPDEARKASQVFRLLAGKKDTLAHVTNVAIETQHASVPIRIYTPEGSGPFPVLIYFHGGGWVICDLDSHDQACRALAYHTPCMVIAVDYRLAPEHPFPAAVEDAYDVLLWVDQHADDFNINRKFIAIGGDSAGGNLSAVTTIAARDRNGPSIAWQMLIYPVTDLSRFDTPSYQDYAENYFLTTSLMEWFRNHYIPNEQDRLTTEASPLLAANLADLPPAWVLTAEFDPLRDEGEAYAKRLHEAGVPVTCIRYNQMFHPFWSLAGMIDTAYDAQQEAATAFAAMIND